MSEWKFETLDNHLKEGSIFASRGDVISKIDIETSPGKYPIYSSSAQKNGKFGEYGKFMFDEELITWSVDGGGNFFHRPKHKFSVTNVCGYLRVISKDIDPLFLFYSLDDQHSRLNFDYQSKAHPSVIRKLYSIPKIDHAEQLQIARVIKSLDSQIEQTEALIAKQENIRQGLMQDLFTRGVDETGQLRPAYEDAPHLYHETDLGWLPKGWEVRSIDDCVDSLIDGPFGSNLKTEHYVPSPGVRVVRLQNIQEYQYDDSDKMYVSERHATKLARYTVYPGDVLIASLGDDNYVAGRACIYPEELPSGLNKADCFRLRVNKSLVRSEFIMLTLNSTRARRGLRKLTQGVTRQRINSTNYKRLLVAIPNAETGEQDRIIEALSSASKTSVALRNEKVVLESQKSGLMRDLLSGDVSVAPLMQDNVA